MLDDLEWAAADLDRAKGLYERGTESGTSLDETWENAGYLWHIRSWRDVTPTVHGAIPGLWNVSLSAHGPQSVWTFAWSGDGWFAT
jgi:hypothetical protein